LESITGTIKTIWEHIRTTGEDRTEHAISRNLEIPENRDKR